MKTIQLQVDDNNYDSFMNILNNLKQGFIKNLKVNNHDIQFVCDDEQKDYENILNNISSDDKIISSKESIQI